LLILAVKGGWVGIGVSLGIVDLLSLLKGGAYFLVDFSPDCVGSSNQGFSSFFCSF